MLEEHSWNEYANSLQVLWIDNAFNECEVNWKCISRMILYSGLVRLG